MTDPGSGEPRDEPDSRPRTPAEMHEHLAGERKRLVEMRDRMLDLTARGRSLTDQMISLRRSTAEQADQVAEHAEAHADYLEHRAARGTGADRDRRLAMAEKEREIAAVERRNAAKLRHAGPGPLDLEPTPGLFDEGEDPE